MADQDCAVVPSSPGVAGDSCMVCHASKRAERELSLAVAGRMVDPVTTPDAGAGRMGSMPTRGKLSRATSVTDEVIYWAMWVVLGLFLVGALSPMRVEGLGPERSVERR